MSLTRVTTQDIKDATILDADIALATLTSAKMAATGVTPTSYTNTNLTVDVAGRITAASNGSASGTFVDGEVPAGTVNGINDTFTVTNAPSPASSLHLYKNGLRMKSGAGNDYTFSGSTITFETAQIPSTGDILLCDYRY